MPTIYNEVKVNGVSILSLRGDTTGAATTLDSYTGHDNTGGAFTGTYVAPTPRMQSRTVQYIPSTTAQSETVTPASGYDGLSSVTVRVNAVPTGTVSNPTATKGSVSNHSVSVTPSVIYSDGYMTAGSKTGTAVTVSASELVSGTLQITDNGEKDVTNYEKVNVNVSGGGGQSSWTLLGTHTFTVSTTSTSASSVGTIQCGAAAYTKAKIIYVRVRDTAGPRAGYFLGSDAFFINTNAANGSTSTFNAAAKIIHRYATGGTYAQTSTATSTGYGVYGYNISSAGAVGIYRRYNQTYSLTINGSYKCEVYALDYPDGINPFTI